jgi:hypothetical protein
MSTEIPNHIIIPVEFSCTIINERLIIGNAYTLSLIISPIDTPTTNDIGFGFQRIRHFVSHYLQDSVLINKNHNLVDQFKELDNNVVYLPCDPYDYYIGCILLAKFISITEKYFDIEHLSIDSIVGDRVQYGIGDPSDANIDIKGDYWWNSDTVSTGHKTVITWEELNLTQIPKFQPTVIQGGLSGSK